MKLLRQKAVIFEWPIAGPSFGKTVRFFDMIGPFVLKRVGNSWNVSDSRKANPKGGPDNGFWFNNLNDAIEHMNNHI